MNTFKLQRIILPVNLVLAAIVPLYAAGNPAVKLAPLNPDFVKWQQSAGTSKAVQTLAAPESGGYEPGYIPSPFDWSHLANEPIIIKFPRLGAGAGDKRYDLRTDNLMTPVRNQGTCGCCWTFATYGSMESCLLKNGQTWDFSEQNLKNKHRFNSGPCLGGNFDMSTAYLARWNGAIDESDDPYNAGLGTSPSGLPVMRHVKNVRIFADSVSIRTALTTYGALAAMMHYDTFYFDASNKSYYFNQTSGDTALDHGITIAGWDDTITTAAGPSKKGAWLIKNSWGTGWGGNDGYFWLSYYDTKACKLVYAFTDAVPVDTSETNYYYDTLGQTSAIGFSGPDSTRAWGANIFTPSKNDSLSAIGFYACANNTSYKICVYDSFNVSDSTFYTQLGSSVTGTLSNAGYYTIALPSKIYRASGNNFGVVVKFTTPGYGRPIPLECPFLGYSDSAKASPGQSYFSYDSLKHFADLTKDYASSNVCIRAFGASSTVPAAPTAPVLSSPSNGTTGQPTSLTLTWSAGSGGGTPDKYRLQVATNDTFQSAKRVFDDSLTGTSQLISGLTKGITYYWRVYAKNGGGTSPWSTTWNFTTIKTYPLTAAAAPAAGGTVSPSGTTTVDSGAATAVSASVNAGYRFVKWTRSGTAATFADSMSASTTVTLTGAATVTANFIKTYSLTVSTSTGGTVIPSGSQTVDTGVATSIAATASAGYRFAKWTRSGTGAVFGDSMSASTTVALSAAATVTANFIKTFTVTTAVSPAASGNVTKSPDQAQYDTNSTMTLTAVPNTGYRFTGWTGDTTESANPITIRMNANKSVTANFIKTFTMTITAANGTVAKVPDQTAYDTNTTVTLTATPVAGYRFTGWTGDTTESANPITIRMNANKSVTANFIKTFTITITAVNGTVAKVPDQTAYDTNTTVTLTATPAVGYLFTGWTGDTTNAANPLTVIVKKDRAITANFTIKQYAITLTAVNGTVAKLPNQTQYDSNSTVLLTATPNTGYQFTGWTGDTTESANPITIRMNASKSVTANFSIKTYTLSVTAVNGTVVKLPNQAQYDSNSTVLLTATPNTGYQFTGWTGDTTESANPITMRMNASKSVTANFTIKQYAITITAVNGTVAKVPDQTAYDTNTTVTLTATPAVGYLFTGWTGDTTESANPITIRMNANKSVTANFSIKTYTLTASATNGTVAKLPNQTQYDSNSTVLLTATPNTGYQFTGWTGDTTESANPITMHMNASKSVTANFTIKQFAITITSVNGTVAKVPDQTAYDTNTTVTLTAAPAAGYLFTGWTGDTTESANPITMRMNASKSVTANFTIKQYAITITAVNGTVAKVPDQGLYDSNSTVTLTATPAAGYRFTGWTGDTTNVANPITMRMNANKSVTANFIKTFTITITAANGTVAKVPDQTAYDTNTTVTLTAAPAAGYQFTGWTGDTTESANPITIRMNANKSVTANFSIKTYTLTASATNGTVAKLPNQTQYDSNSTVLLTATPNTGYQFTGWTGDTTESANPITMRMIANKSVTANFSIKTYTLTVSATNGTVAKLPNQAQYDSNSTVQLTATPNTGYQFTGWTGDTTESANPITMRMNASKSVTANFSIKTYTLSVSATNGTVAKVPDQGLYDSNSTVQLTATPNTGYQFTGWTGDTTESANPITMRMNASKSVTANFSIKTYTLSVTAVNGTVVKLPNQAQYDSNSTVTLTATPAAGYQFTGWTGDTTESANPVTIRMNANKSVTAIFSIKTYTLTVSATNGTVAKLPNQTQYDSNSTVLLTATPNTGYQFTGWTGDTTESANPITMRMIANKSVTANFSIKTYTLTVSATNGTVAKLPTQAQYDSNSTVQLTATPNTGYQFTGWTGDTTESANPITMRMNASKSVTANFTIKQYAITITAVNGTVANVPDQSLYDSNSTVQLTATPNTNYQFTGWTGDTIESANPIIIRMNSNKSMTANFAINTYSLTISAGTGGTITVPVSSPVSVGYGVATPITAVPNAGYDFSYWNVISGTSIGYDDPYSASTNIYLYNGNATIAAVFVPHQYQLTVNTGVGGSTYPLGTITVAHGAATSIIATPAWGYDFVKWTVTSGRGTSIGDSNSASTTITLTDSNAAVQAVFAIQMYQLSVSARTGGTITAPASSPVSVGYGVATPITAVPDAGYDFSNWNVISGTLIAIDDSYSASTIVYIYENAAIEAVFTPHQYLLTVNAGVGGTTSPWGIFTVNHGVATSIIAQPYTGYYFVRWTRSGTQATIADSANDTTTVVLTAAATVTAVFALKQYTLTTNATNGSVTRSPDQTVYDSNTVVQLSASAGTGYHFTGWSGDTTETADPIDLLMNANKNVTANFVLDLPSVPVQRSPSDNAVILVDSVVFIWNPATPGIDRYTLEIATDSLMSAIVVSDTVFDTSRTRKGLASGASYWWRVKAHNASGWGSYSDTLKFSLASTAVILPKSYSLNLNGGVSGARSIIKYSLPATSQVSIRIYSIQGKLIKTLVNSRQTAGYYQIPANISALSKGFYILTFNAGNHVIRKKLVNF